VLISSILNIKIIKNGKNKKLPRPVRIGKTINRLVEAAPMDWNYSSTYSITLPPFYPQRTAYSWNQFAKYRVRM